MKKYDSIIFGNGFNYAVDGTVANRTKEYKYLFNLKSFLEKIIDYEDKKYSDTYVELAEEILNDSRKIRLKNILDRIQLYYEEETIEVVCNIETRLVEFATSFVSCMTKNNVEKFYFLARFAVKKYSLDINNKDSNIPFKLSNRQIKKLKEYENSFSEFLTDIYTLYNVHDIVKNFYISQSKELDDIRREYYIDFFKKHLTRNALIMTTNYGNEIRRIYPNIEYIHGTFVDYKEILSSIGEVIGNLSIKKEGEYDKFLFAATAYKKHLVVDKGIYEDKFFIDRKRKYGNLVIFGLSFAKIYGEFNKYYSKYSIEERHFDMNIDGHIMKRIDELLTGKKMKSVTIVAYDDVAEENYKSFLSSYRENQQTQIWKWYKTKRIHVISYSDFVQGTIKYSFWKKGR